MYGWSGRNQPPGVIWASNEILRICNNGRHCGYGVHGIVLVVRQLLMPPNACWSSWIVRASEAVLLEKIVARLCRKTHHAPVAHHTVLEARFKRVARPCRPPRPGQVVVHLSGTNLRLHFQWVKYVYGVVFFCLISLICSVRVVPTCSSHCYSMFGFKLILIGSHLVIRTDQQHKTS